MPQKDYQNWSKDKLVQEIENLLKRKKFGLVWEPKPEEVAEKCKDFLPVLKEENRLSVKDKNSKLTHALIEGDNYHALSVLNYTHKKRVDVIYIDPPYNTGNKDFKYNDTYVDREDSYRHSKWLSFMSKRLKLARNLLKDSGVIFISIDDNEQAYLKILCDEIFGPKNFIGQIIIKSNPRGSQASKHLADVHEYLLVYAKSENQLKLGGFEKNEADISEYSFIEKDGRSYRLLGLRQRGGAWKREQRPNMFFPIYVDPKTGSISLSKSKVFNNEVFPKRPTGEEGRWTWSKDKVSKDAHLLIGKKVNRKGEENFFDIFRKDFITDDEGDHKLSKPKTIWDDKEINYQNGRQILKEIFNGDDIFDYPKPVFLIKNILRIVNNKKAVVLDFMAGSGTTAQAVLELNHEDGGQRQFLLCTNNEVNGLREKLEKEGLPEKEIAKYGICRSITHPRIQRLLEGYTNAEKEKIVGFGGNLKYYVTTFVEKVKTDNDKRVLVSHCTEMLCLAENTFNPIIAKTGDFAIFENDVYQTGIIYDEDSLQDFKRQARKLTKPLNVYIFSYDHTYNEEDFEEINQLVKVKPIPEVILNIYKKIHKDLFKAKMQ